MSNCVIRPTTFGSSVICAKCGSDCECVVCLPLDQQENNS